MTELTSASIDRLLRSALSHRGAAEPRERADLLASLAIAERGLDQRDVVLANLQEALEIHIKLGGRGEVEVGGGPLPN